MYKYISSENIVDTLYSKYYTNTIRRSSKKHKVSRYTWAEETMFTLNIYFVLPSGIPVTLSNKNTVLVLPKYVFTLRIHSKIVYIENSQ